MKWWYMINSQFYIKSIMFMMYLTIGFIEDSWTSTFAFFPDYSLPLYGSVCWDLYLVLVCVPITNFISSHEYWLGATLGWTVGWGELVRMVLRRELSCWSSSVRYIDGAMHMQTATHWIFDTIPVRIAEFVTVASQLAHISSPPFLSSLWDSGVHIHNEVNGTSSTISRNRDWTA